MGGSVGWWQLRPQRGCHHEWPALGPWWSVQILAASQALPGSILTPSLAKLSNLEHVLFSKTQLLYLQKRMLITGN